MSPSLYAKSSHIQGDDDGMRLSRESKQGRTTLLKFLRVFRSICKGGNNIPCVNTCHVNHPQQPFGAAYSLVTNCRTTNDCFKCRYVHPMSKIPVFFQVTEECTFGECPQHYVAGFLLKSGELFLFRTKLLLQVSSFFNSEYVSDFYFLLKQL